LYITGNVGVPALLNLKSSYQTVGIRLVYIDTFKFVGYSYVYFYSAANEFGELAPRVGFFHDFQKSEFLVKKWDNKKEDISSECKQLLSINMRFYIQVLHEFFK